MVASSGWLGSHTFTRVALGIVSTRSPSSGGHGGLGDHLYRATSFLPAISRVPNTGVHHVHHVHQKTERSGHTCLTSRTVARAPRQPHPAPRSTPSSPRSKGAPQPLQARADA